MNQKKTFRPWVFCFLFYLSSFFPFLSILLSLSLFVFSVFVLIFSTGYQISICFINSTSLSRTIKHWWEELKLIELECSSRLYSCESFFFLLTFFFFSSVLFCLFWRMTNNDEKSLSLLNWNALVDFIHVSLFLFFCPFFCSSPCLVFFSSFRSSLLFFFFFAYFSFPFCLIAYCFYFSFSAFFLGINCFFFRFN